MCIQMATNASCGNRDLGLDAPQSGVGERQALRKAMKRAAKAQRRLHEAIYRAEACGQDNTSSSSESDGEGAVFRGRRSAGEGGRARFHPHHHGFWTGPHGMRGAHGSWAAMRGFPPGRHMMGFSGFGAGFPGMMSRGVGPYSHPHPHYRHHGHHHHHHRGAFGEFHSLPARGGHCGCGGRSGRGGLGHGPPAGPFNRHFTYFGDVGHCSGRRERAHSAPRF